MSAELRFSFRRFVDDDIEMMHGWLNDPGVVQWWEGEDVSLHAVTSQYGSARDDLDTEHWIAEIADQPVGWLQCWPAANYLEETEPWFPLGVEQSAAGIDYLVATADRRGQGLGSAMIRAFTFNVVFGRHCEWTQAAASPFAANVASCRALEKAGFAFAGSIRYEGDDKPCSLMVMNR